ncbi:protein PLASTID TRANSCRIPTIONALLY ACTIVE 14-like [Lotus japonicus]|uniref:protein PLASTID TRANSCRIPTIONALLY ACTIVE 14-like n=1 Tax=Lotus japonicus TaxID=34305 RepID=UPI002583ED5A|nr:protein PLASTID TRANSCRIPTIONALLY ACTIVE 14-like [Lotus japonicus]XP_057457605.1 protein PLASTID TRANSCRIPTIONALLY ACTIVE 14-like [Lotus japonicus]
MLEKYVPERVLDTPIIEVIMEIPLELMLTISKKLPWMFFPDIIPIGHPIFDIINPANPETNLDLRLACLLLYAFDCQENFWQLYGDFLLSADESTSLFIATEVLLQQSQGCDFSPSLSMNTKGWYWLLSLKVWCVWRYNSVV